jgi:hypothetical protein
VDCDTAAGHRQWRIAGSSRFLQQVSRRVPARRAEARTSTPRLHKCEISCSEAARQYLARILKWSVPHGPTFSLKTNYYIIFYRDRNVSNISALHKRYVTC